MRKKLKKYRVTAEDSEAFACSLVTDPAVEELFVAFSEDKRFVEKLADSTKHMVTGVVAVPDKPIYRNNGTEEYEIVFSKDAIESMAKKFMKNIRQKNVTLQHEEDAEGIYMVEQWIKTDASHDKSVALGFSADIPTGTWFQSYYVDSNEIWNRITSGELRGFSLECVLGVEEFEKQIASFEADEAPAATEPVSNEVDTSAKVVEPVNEEKPVIQEEEEIPVKTSILDKILNILGGVPVKKEEEPKVEENVVNEPEPEPVTEVEKKDETQIEETVEEKKEELPNPLEDVVKNLKAEIESLKDNNSKLLEKIKDMSDMPSVKPTNTNPKGNGGNSDDAYIQWRETVSQMIG